MSITDLGGERGATGRDDKPSPKDLAASAAATVKQEAASFADSAKEKVAEKVEEKAHVATQTLGDFASAIRKAGDDLAQHDQSLAGQMVKRAADGLESFSRSIGDKRPEDLLNAVRDFGRNNPAAFIAGSVLLGIALGRLAKSTEQRSADDPEYRRPTDYLAATDSRSATSPTTAYSEGYPVAGAAVDSPYGSGV
jgi:hypothetical protein